MTLNPQYDPLAKTFVQEFYGMFDDPARRAQLASFYNEDRSMMTFEGEQFFGCSKIMQKIQDCALRVPKFYTLHRSIYVLFAFSYPKVTVNHFGSLTFQKIAHNITAVDAQPMFDGGILIAVLGQLKTDDDPPHGFNQVFILKPQPDIGRFYVAHDSFRLSLHSM